MKENSRILVISDLQAPYIHRDAPDFLALVKEIYQPTRVIQIGDEADFHNISFHDSDPDLHSSRDELKKCIESLQPLYEMFPEVDLLESNHGSLVYRRAKASGLPREVIKDYREILKAPKGWNWHFDMIVPTEMGKVYFHHGKSRVPGKLSQNMGMSSVQGHFHSNFYIYYWASPIGLYFDMNVGCLMDFRSLAAAYGKNMLKKPILGCGMIIDGVPLLIPMVLNSNHRWNGKI